MGSSLQSVSNGDSIYRDLVISWHLLLEYLVVLLPRTGIPDVVFGHQWETKANSFVDQVQPASTPVNNVLQLV